MQNLVGKVYKGQVIYLENKNDNIHKGEAQESNDQTNIAK